MIPQKYQDRKGLILKNRNKSLKIQNTKYSLNNVHFKKLHNVPMTFHQKLHRNGKICVI